VGETEAKLALLCNITALNVFQFKDLVLVDKFMYCTSG
jgi:hypothetical protein